MRVLSLVFIIGLSFCLLSCSSTQEWASVHYDSLVGSSDLPVLRHKRDAAMISFAEEKEAFERLEKLGGFPLGSKDRVKAVILYAGSYYNEMGPVIDDYYEYNNDLMHDFVDDSTSGTGRKELSLELEHVRNDLFAILKELIGINRLVSKTEQSAREESYAWNMEYPKPQHAPWNIFKVTDLSEVKGFDWEKKPKKKKTKVRKTPLFFDFFRERRVVEEEDLEEG